MNNFFATRAAMVEEVKKEIQNEKGVTKKRLNELKETYWMDLKKDEKYRILEAISDYEPDIWTEQKKYVNFIKIMKFFEENTDHQSE